MGKWLRPKTEDRRPRGREASSVFCCFGLRSFRSSVFLGPETTTGETAFAISPVVVKEAYFFFAAFFFPAFFLAFFLAAIVQSPVKE